jgi:hypothetical protein
MQRGSVLFEPRADVLSEDDAAKIADLERKTDTLVGTAGASRQRFHARS